MKPQYVWIPRMTRRRRLGKIEIPHNRTKMQCKRVVEACKDRLKREKNPDKRYRLATIGEEFNLLYMQL